MHTHTIHLRQHTPIIHFQHDQHGATLRATELKPKLDKYIMEKLLRDKNIPIDPHKSIHEQFKAHAKQNDWLKWLVGKGKAEHVALDYKVRIVPLNQVKDYSISQPIRNNEDSNRDRENKKIEVKPYPMYFANMGKTPAEKDVLKNGRIGNVAITFTSFYNELLTQITDQDLICSFFFRENFGTRQSKGFGCFYPMDARGNDFPVAPLKSDSIFHFQLNTQKFRNEIDRGLNNTVKQEQWIECDPISRIFKALEWFYQSLRNGINYKVGGQNLYLKPSVFQYAKDKHNLPWDKRSVKGVFFNTQLRKQQGDHPSSEPLHFYPPRTPLVHWDFKDLLGFSSAESWRSYDSTLTKSFGVQYFEKGKSKEEKDLTRFKSPMRFHIMNRGEGIFDIWFWMEKIPANYKKAKVNFECGSKKTTFQMADMFDENGFLHYLFSQKNTQGKYISTLDKRLEKRFNNAPHAKVLTEIYNNIAKP